MTPCARRPRGREDQADGLNWNTEAPAIRYLQSLALLPNVEIRIVTPQASSGFIPSPG
jgi:hypothetical protein